MYSPSKVEQEAQLSQELHDALCHWIFC